MNHSRSTSIFRYIGILCFMLSVHWSAAQTIYDSVYISKAQALEDLRQLDQKFKRNYKPYDLPLVIEDYQQNLKNLKSNLPDRISLEDFRVEVVELLGAFREAHMGVGLTHPFKSQKQLRKAAKNDKGPKVLPFDISLHDGYFRVHYDYRPDSLRTGVIDSITHIGGQSVDELLKYFADRFRGDIDSEELRRRFLTHRIPRNVRALMKPYDQDSISIKYIGNGEARDTWIKYVFSKKVRDGQRLNMIDSMSTCTVRLDRFRAIGYYTDSSKYVNLFKVVMDSIQRFNPDNVVFDLRQNGGGSARLCRKLLSGLLEKGDVIYETNATGIIFIPFLFSARFKLGNRPKHKRKAKPKDNGYKGNVYVIIDEGSYSGSMIFARALQVHDRATIVGQPSGQKDFGTHAGFNKALKLKHSGAVIRIPQIYFKMDDRPIEALEYKGVQPDIPLPYDLDANNKEDYDATMDYILNLIYEQRQSN